MPSARIWAPWNLVLGDYSCISHDVDCYCVDRIIIGKHVTVSQYAFLCTASHDICSTNMQLITSPIEIGDGAWVCAGAFVSPGTTLGIGAVVGARSVVRGRVEPWAVMAGNPATFVKRRQIRQEKD